MFYFVTAEFKTFKLKSSKREAALLDIFCLFRKYLQKFLIIFFYFLCEDGR